MLVAHDLGTTGNKASLHDEDGRLVRAVTVRYETRFDHGGIAEQDPDRWWEAVCAATRSLLSDAGAGPDRVRAVGFSGQMMGAVLLDAAYRPVRRAIIWADHRSTEQCRRLVDKVGMEPAYRITGHRLHPMYLLSKGIWVRDTEPEVFARVAHFCLAKDFVVQRLTGELVTDPSDASSTNAYDQGRGRGPAELRAPPELDPALFPAIVPSPTVVGGVTAEAAELTGLRAGPPVV